MNILQDIFHYVPPVMHIVMGLGNLVFKELKRLTIELDEKESNFSSESHKTAEEELLLLYERKNTLSTIHANYSLNSMIILNDMKRLSLLVAGKLTEAETVARENYSEKTKKSRRKKTNCGAAICLIYPFDEMNGYSDKIECKNRCDLHARCEGVVLLDGEDLPDIFECKRCLGYGENVEWLGGTLKTAKLLLEDQIHDINTELRDVKMKIETLEDVTLKCGVRYSQLKESCKILKLEPAKYHGGDFEGKAIQQLLDCARRGQKNEEPTFEILKCIKDKDEIYGKFKRAFTTMQQVSDTFRLPIEHFDDDAVDLVRKICEEWGKNWTQDFPHINLTPKGHDMIFVLPEVLSHTRMFHMFYKMEERGEALHAQLNGIKRKIWNIRSAEKRMWKYIESYELKNQLDVSIINPKKRANV